MRGPGYTNWVIKRHLLCGPHPGATSTADSVKTLSGLLHEGVTAFVALQEEMPSPMVTASVKTSALPSKRAQASYGNRNAITAKPYIDDAQVSSRIAAAAAAADIAANVAAAGIGLACGVGFDTQLSLSVHVELVMLLRGLCGHLSVCVSVCVCVCVCHCVFVCLCLSVCV